MPRKNFRKIIMTLVISFIMLLGINVNAQTYEVYANGSQFSDDNLVVPCGEGTATFDPATRTLTLENATISQSNTYGLIEDNEVENPGVLNIVVIGNNVLDGNDGAMDGLDTSGKGLNITGSGTLTMQDVWFGVYTEATDDFTISISGITLNIDSLDQALVSGNGISFNNANVTINANPENGGVVENSTDGVVEVTNSNIAINSSNPCINLAGNAPNRKFILNSGKVVLTSEGGYALSAEDPENASIEINGGTLRLNGASGGTNITDINIAEGHAMTKGDSSSSTEIEIAPAITISGKVSWIDNDNAGNTRPTGDLYVMVKNPNGTTANEQVVKASNNWAYSMQVAMNDNDGNPISYTLAIDEVEGYNSVIAGNNITMVLNGMSTDEVIPAVTTYTKVVASGTLLDREGTTIDTKSFESDLLTGTTTDSVVTSKINEYKELFNTWASENDATGSTTSEEITNILFESDQVPGNTYSTMDDLVEAYKSAGGTGVLNVKKVQTYTMVYQGTKNPEREKTTISGAIDWEDSANQDGKRPQSVTVSIKNGQTLVDSQVVTAANNWEYTFEGLFVQDTEGNNITYTLDGTAINGYTISLDGNNLVYTHTPEKTTISGTINWDDNSDSLGLRPENITITLYKNGVVQDTQTKTSENGSYIFANLDKYAGGTEASYTIQITSVENYLSLLNGYNITMSCKKAVISGGITFVDDNNINNSRPLQVEAQIKVNNTVVETKTLSSATNWKFTATVDKYDSSNNQLTYTVDYPNVTDYDKSVSGYNATYTYAVTTVDVAGKINWDDDNNRDGLRPSKVVVTLYNGSTAVKTVDVTSQTNWNYSFSGLNKKDDQGNNITYSVSAQSNFEGYEFTQSGNNFSYAHTPEKINITGNIIWNDNDDQDSLRPTNLTIELRNGNTAVREATLSSSNWSYEFNNVYKYANGAEVNYTIAPASTVPRYTFEQSGNNLIFSHTHETIEIKGNITWNDNNNQDGFRPNQIEVGVYVGTEKVRFMEVSADNGWNYSFPELDKYDENGNTITYTIKSNSNLTGYTYATNGYNIIYTHNSENVSLQGSITWEDNNNALNLRPTSVKVTLLANDSEYKSVTLDESSNWNYNFTNLPKYKDGQEVVYSISGQTIDNYKIQLEENNITYECNKVKLNGQITFNDESNQDGIRPTKVNVTIKHNSDTIKEVEVTETNNWKFQELVDKYDTSNNVMEYTVSYPDVENYTKETSGNNATYSHTPEKTNVSGTIKFDDKNNQDKIRPSKVVVTLKNGNENVTTKEVNITGETTDFEFTNVFKYKNGSEINYSFEGSAVSDYEVTVSGKEITYKHNIATTRVEGKIIWDDESNQDGKRPGQIEVTLSNGSKETVTAVDNWEFSFTGLDKYNNGELIEYSVSSKEDLEGYEYSKEGYNITYKHTPEKITLTGKVIFDDSSNQDGIRPSKVTLNIDNGTNTSTKEVTITGDTTNYEISNLPKYGNGSEINYSVTGSQINKYEVSNSNNDITYKHTTDKVTISGKVIFDDYSNQDGKRPNEVEITLSNGDTTTATKDNNYEYEFKDLPKNNNGEEISYTITAPEIDSYSKEVNGNNITYKHTKETVKLEGNITFTDDNNKYGFRPNEITVTIKNGSSTAKTIKVKESDNWKYSATLDKYSNGEEINYTISTNEVSNYKLINNSPNFEYQCTKIKITTKVSFSDNDDEAGLRPDKVNIELYGNTSLVQTIELTSSNNYSKTLTLDKYASDNTEIAYTITPETIDSYVVTSSDYTATYTYNGVAKKKISGEIKWNDSTSKTRPESVTVVLYQNGVEYTRLSVKESDNWKYVFRGLPKEDDEGLEIEYTIDVESVNGYTSSIDGNNITLDKINYRIIEGNGQTVVISEDDNAEFRINGDYDLFDKLYIDNKLVDENNYKVREGSTIITLKDSFVKSLKSGKHSIKATFTDGGEATGTFIVQRENTTDSVKEIINPTTGDKLVLYVFLLITSLLSIFVIRTNIREAN